MSRPSTCPFCKEKFEGWGYNATLLDSEPQRFCSKTCFERLRLIRQRKSWVGRERVLARQHPDLYKKLFGSLEPSDAKRMNEELNPCIQQLNDETHESEVYLEQPFVSFH